MKKFIVISALALSIVTANARDLGQWGDIDSAISQWFQSLKQPDNPIMSCCGESDAYYADKIDTDEHGNLIAIITDTRPDEPLKRKHVPVGTRILVPKEKIRKKTLLPNPTDHTIIFLRVSQWSGNVDYGVYCYEPLSGT